MQSTWRPFDIYLCFDCVEKIIPNQICPHSEETQQLVYLISLLTGFSLHLPQRNGSDDRLAKFQMLNRVAMRPDRNTDIQDVFFNIDASSAAALPEYNIFPSPYQGGLQG